MSINIYEEIQCLIEYGLSAQIIEEDDEIYTRNAILEVLDLDEFQEVEVTKPIPQFPAEILQNILKWAANHGRLQENTITYRDLLDTKMMACFVSKPSAIIEEFRKRYDLEGPEEATKYYYLFSKKTNYIREDRIQKNEQWTVDTIYGDIEITINLSKPELDPRDIAAAKGRQKSNYPSCLLCKENIGYAGRIDHPARQNHRTIPIQLDGDKWHIQFSPYVYYNEHAIIFSDEHQPMKISNKTFDRILTFTEQFPHYFIGSNADLPIVGGSILSHDHYQGGKHDFPMAKAEMDNRFSIAGYSGVQAGIVHWPMSVIRLQGENQFEISDLANNILLSWKNYSDPTVDLVAYTEDTSHNTITPIARRRGVLFELDLVLRNNRTSIEHPMGIFHPHAEVHHIKKENIGLIEVMGFAILPGRLKEELERLAAYVTEPNWEEQIMKDEKVRKHLDWARDLSTKYDNFSFHDMERLLKQEIGLIFSSLLEHAGVFKRDEKGQQAFKKFLKTIKG